MGNDYVDWMHAGDIVTAGGAMGGRCCLVTATYTDGTADVEDPFAREAERVDQEDLVFVDRPFCIGCGNGRYMVDNSSTGVHVHILDEGGDAADADKRLVDEVRKHMLEGYENQ